jgi:hypothetical protein
MKVGKEQIVGLLVASAFIAADETAEVARQERPDRVSSEIRRRARAGTTSRP